MLGYAPFTSFRATHHAQPATDSASVPACCTFQPSMSPSHATAPGERIRTVIVDDHDDIGRLVACRIADVIRTKAAVGGRAVLGLATGSTPIGVYRELIRLHREEWLSFASVVSITLY
jgi:glucosamine-6-phosphate deaminase